jgi:hypothetical protein
MPKRQRIVKVSTEEVQGSGSWAKVSKLTVREMRDAQNAMTSNPTDMEQFELGLEMVKDHVVEWNWVDDNGDPLPQPRDDPAVVELLSNDEISVLALGIRGDLEKQKN